jgi:threonine synthase
VRCGAAADIGPVFAGCAACPGTGAPAAVEVVYAYAALRESGTLAAWAARAGGLWRFRECLPLPPGASVLTREEGATPLVRLEATGPARVWLKDETRNPTGSFKDRFHAVSVAMARTLGFDRVTGATTGHHGTARAPYAARAGLAAVVFCDPRAPVVQRRLMQLFGARVVVLADREAHLGWVVRERGWYPSTGTTPAPVATPYGVEGYQTIAYESSFQLRDAAARPAAGGLGYPTMAYEIFFQLGGRFPGRVLAPTSGGDAVEPRTIALSIADATGGAIALRALAESGGAAEAVPDAALVEAARRLGRQGIAVEPAAATPVAAALALAARGEVGADEDVVCVLTGGGARRPEALLEVVEPRELCDAAPAAAAARPPYRRRRPLGGPARSHCAAPGVACQAGPSWAAQRTASSSLPRA